MAEIGKGRNMDWMAMTVVVESDHPEMAQDLVADVMHGTGLTGVVLISPGRDPEADWAKDALEAPTFWGVTGYFPANDTWDMKKEAVKSGLNELSSLSGFQWTMEEKVVHEIDWAEAWKEYFWPERITGRVVVKPTWREYDPAPDDVVIEIDPGMAFGTGSHPTTALCIGAIERYVRPGNTVLDVGTGSGILLVAAHKFGSGILYGVDTDSVAVRVAGENLALNRVPEDRYVLAAGNLVDTVRETFDIVVANILSEVIVRLLDDVPKVLKPGGLFICSGIVDTNAPMVREKLAATGFTLQEEKEKDQWVCMVATRP